MINSNAKVSNTFQMFPCMLCNGASNAEPLCSSSECCCSSDIHMGLSCNEWTHEFLCLSYAFHMIFWEISISSNFSTYIRMLQDKVAPNLHWIVCRRESSGSAKIQAYALRDMQDTVQYHISYVSIFDWSGQGLHFALLFNFSSIVLFTVWSMCRADKQDWVLDCPFKIIL